MTTIAQIITDAYQYNNLVALTAIPSAEEQAKGLRYFNRIFQGVFGNELGEQLATLNIGENNVTYEDTYASSQRLVPPYFLPSNHRFVLNINLPITAYFPSAPQDGAIIGIQDAAGNLATYPFTIRGNGRTIEGSSFLTLSTNSFNERWFYRADLGNWVKITSFTLLDAFPLPEEFEEFFIIMLALRLNASSGVASSPEISLMMRETNKKLKTRYSQSYKQDLEMGLTRMSLTSAAGISFSTNT